MTLKYFAQNSYDGPIEAGQTRGMTPEYVIERYLKPRNSILTLLRIYTKAPIDKLASELNLTVTQIIELEQSDERIPFQYLPKIANFYKVDLKILLIFLGHTKGTDMNHTELPLAAQYSGPDLTREEKIDLDELMKLIISKIDKTKE